MSVMPRPLVYGNGSLLVGLDATYTIRDLFYPQVGRFNHLNGHPIRMGVWMNGDFSWCDSDQWTRKLAYDDHSLVGEVTLENQRECIRLDIHECVSQKANCF